jgi:uncharacterized protein YegJ (DUF2314 family)
MLKYGLAATILVAIAFASLGFFLARRAPQPNAAALKLAVAVRQAQRRLPEFRKRLETPRESDRNFFVRVQLPARGGRSEYLWLKRVKPAKNGFSGTIDEEPTLRTDLRKGSELTVTNDEVVDWSIRTAEGKLEGALTNGLEIP